MLAAPCRFLDLAGTVADHVGGLPGLSTAHLCAATGRPLCSAGAVTGFASLACVRIRSVPGLRAVAPTLVFHHAALGGTGFKYYPLGASWATCLPGVTDATSSLSLSLAVWPAVGLLILGGTHGSPKSLASCECSS